jgi:pilus assembly protein CpaE
MGVQGLLALFLDPQQGCSGMRFYLVSDDDSIATAIRGAILDRGLECPASNQCRILGVPGLLNQLAPPVTSSLPGWGARELPSDNDVTLILVMPDDQEFGLQVIQQIRSACSHRLLVVGDIQGGRAVLRAMRQGASEYLDRMDLANELGSALDRLDQRTKRAFSVGICSAVGGAGCSVLAANLGCELSRSRSRCGLVDLKLEGGDLASLLDLKPQYTLADVNQNVEGFDSTLLKGCLASHACGVQLLAASMQFPSFVPVDVRGVGRAFSMLGRQVDFIVADLDRCLGQATFATAQAADLLLCVMRLDFVSLRRTKLLLDFLMNGNVAQSKIRIVANRCGQSGEIPVSQVEDALRMKVQTQIPEDSKLVLRSINNGEPAVLTAPTSKFSRRIQELAAEIQGLAMQGQPR